MLQAASEAALTVPPLEAALSAAGIHVLASGDLGPQLKLFEYAIGDADGAHFLVQALVDKASRTMSVTVKSDAPLDAAGAAQRFLAARSAGLRGLWA